ncbi:hypothetical protein HYH02_001460 [Chlamydomonas schloesseri]|uniref:Alpha-type protein kinase domain-containing protein n=1 Tax=Chlamydomonas schloesseri TaxID=2026947 RepID=A0A835WXK6_9CHLO|nr:hypothetical protein HYH02_001460 [Chlamydomonas schloesseri]|eukprot:KAG2454441.1 hypothetical protein HYH02_001460 [Chlamydomonas schloesseri]
MGGMILLFEGIRRGIERRELQEAVKYGRQERANPGRDGQVRWRYTHKGVVYITDETSRHEITSWRLNDAPDAPPAATIGSAAGGATAHMILVVDHSGSMRKDDVPGYGSRTAAVYDCLARDLVEPQLKLEGGSIMEVSLIQMQNQAEVVLRRSAPTPDLLEYLNSLKQRGGAVARSHGNYLPALDAALDLMRDDATQQKQLFLVFLSDGAPSDHTTMACAHGYQVWQNQGMGGGLVGDGSGQQRRRGGKAQLVECPFSIAGNEAAGGGGGGSSCRGLIVKSLHQKCLDRIRTMGDLLGRDRVSVNTVAFGPAAEDFTLLRRMSKVLPRGSFQNRGLSANCLRTAFTSLTSSLISLRTEARAGGGGGGGPGLTLRTDLPAMGQLQEYNEHELLANGVSFDIYVGDRFRSKCRYARNGMMLPVELRQPCTYRERFPDAQYGVAHARVSFSEGGERVVFQCTEVVSVDGGATAYAVGPRLVAKQSRHEESLYDRKFNRTFCRMQSEAAELAALFNRRLGRGPAWQVYFLPCHVYTIVDDYYTYAEDGVMEILVEQELEGRYIKWNNNAGGVGQLRLGGDSTTALGAIAEDEKDAGAASEKEEEEQASIDDVPQAFSHFTWDCTEEKKLVCDLQGVWNASDGFTLTDPVIHYVRGSRRNGATDKGLAGAKKFFATHTCNALCRELGLRRGPGQARTTAY